MSLIVWKVYRTEMRMRVYASGGRRSTALRQTKEAGIQGILFIVVAVVCFAPMAAMVILERPGKPQMSAQSTYFVIALLVKVRTV